MFDYRYHALSLAAVLLARARSTRGDDTRPSRPPPNGGSGPRNTSAGPREPVCVRGMSRVASYRADDPAELVAASLACPWCLASDVAFVLCADEEFDASADCRCRACDQSWSLFLAPEQVLRLALAPAR